MMEQNLAFCIGRGHLSRRPSYPSRCRVPVDTALQGTYSAKSGAAKEKTD